MSFLVELPKKAPPWWEGPNLTTLLQAYGQALDERADAILDGRRQGIVWAGGEDAARTGAARLSDGRLLECDPWVIQVHADQRGLRVYETEPELSQRIRCAQHLILKAQRGTHRGEMLHLRPYFATALAYPVLWIQHTTGGGKAFWHRVAADGSYSLGRAANFVRPGSSSKWARYTAFIELPGTGYTLGSEWSAFDWNDGTQYDTSTTITSAVARDWIAMLTDWKSAHSWCDGVVLVGEASKLGPTITPTLGSDGAWSLPSAGQWADPLKRPKWLYWIYDNPAP
jgi:hypothetical protein